MEIQWLVCFLIAITLRLAASQIEEDSGCDYTKTCFSDCTRRNGCGFQVACEVVGDNVQCDIEGTAESGDEEFYIAWALSDDQDMDDDSVIGCKYSAGQVVLFNGKTDGHSVDEAPLEAGVTLDNYAFSNGVLECTITRPVTPEAGSELYDLSQAWYWFFAVGPITDGALVHHSSRDYSDEPVELVMESLLEDNACGISKICFSDCDSGSCNYQVACEVLGDVAQCEIAGYIDSGNDAYVSWALSSDQIMDDDSVIGCKYENDSTTAFNGLNDGHEFVEYSVNSSITLDSYTLSNSLLRCTVTRPITPDAESIHFDLNQAWYWFYAAGRLGDEGELQRHQVRDYSSEEYNITSYLDTLHEDSACGVTKVCFSDCDSSGCTYQVACAVSGDTVECDIAGNVESGQDVYVAWAISEDNYMGDASVLGCRHEDGQISAFNGETSGHTFTESDLESDIKLESSSITNNILRCTVTRPLTPDAGSIHFDLSQAWYWLYSTGIIEDGVLQYHTNRYYTPQVYDVLTDLEILKEDSGCGISKVCFSDCDSSGCSYQVACTETGENVQCDLAAKVTSAENVYVAWGLSEDEEMGDDSVLGCMFEDGQISAFNGETDGHSFNPVSLESNIILESFAISNSILQCSVTRPLIPEAGSIHFDLSQAWHWLFATGSIERNGDIKRHERRYASTEVYDSDELDKTGYYLTEDSECGGSKLCFSDCDSNGCTYQVACYVSGETAQCDIAGNVATGEDSYVSWALSSDTVMDEDSVIGCMYEEGVISIFNGNTSGHTFTTYDLEPEVTLVSSAIVNDVLMCTITRPMTPETGSLHYDLSQAWHWLYAAGVVEDGVPQRHEDRYASDDAYDIIGDLLDDAWDYSACGVTKLCFNDCDSGTCTYQVSCEMLSEVEVQCDITGLVSTTEDKYVAWALSSDTSMGDDSVIGCKIVEGEVSAFNGETSGHSFTESPLANDVYLVSTYVSVDILRCTVSRAITVESFHFDLSQEWYWLFATGDITDGEVKRHDNRYVSPKSYDIVADLADQASQNLLEDSACGITKLCFSDCDSGGCNYQVACYMSGENAQCDIAGNVASGEDTYVAWALSSDTVMDEDSVIGCKCVDGEIAVFNGNTSGHSFTEYPLEENIVLSTGSITNNILRCTIARPVSSEADSLHYDLNQAWYWLFAAGEVDDGVPQRHSARFASGQMYDITADIEEQSGDTPAQTTEPPSASGAVVKDSACGTSKGCFSFCESETSCVFNVAWAVEEDSDTVVYTLSSDVGISSESYIALGFSSDDEMGDDDVIGCAGSSDGTVSVFSSENVGHSTEIYTDDSTVLVQGVVAEGILTCDIKRPVSSYEVNGYTRRDLDQQWILLVARGSAYLNADGSVDSVSYHGASNRYDSGQAVSASELTDIGAIEDEFPLVKLHGALMISAWIFCASIGIVVARYYKPILSQSMCSQKQWFQIHRALMVLAFVACSGGFVVIFIEVGGWVELQETPTFLNSHPILGTVVTGLCVLNPLMALFRPHPEAPTRPVFNWAHFVAGTGSHILAVITIFFGFELDKSNAPDYLKWVLAGYVVWQVLVEVILELVSSCCKKLDRSEFYELTDKPMGQKSDSDSSKSEMKSLKKTIFGIHVLVITAVSAALIGLLVMGK